jgi:ribosomal protein L11 methylase PrmA
LIEQSKRILSLLEPNGTLVLSGILAVQFAKVRGVYTDAGLKLVRIQTVKEWRSGAFAAR